ncbi:MAG: hypothetical protein U0V74_11665 [Chitinophagales bacterium]
MKETVLQVVRELLWLTITAALSFAVLYPITAKLDPFIYYNTVFAFVFVSITYFRWSMMIKSLPFFRPGVVRFLLFAINLSLFIFFASRMQKYLGLMDNFYTEDFGFPKVILYDEDKTHLLKYIYNVIVFFGTASLIMIIALNVRIIIAWWQFYKYKSSALLDD